MTSVLPVAEAEIHRLASQLVRGGVFGPWNVPEDLWSMVFLPVKFGALNNVPREQIGDLIVFAVRGEHKTTGMAINGFPIFVEIRVWLTADVERAMDLANKIRAAEQAVLDAAKG